jgi:hypothetical protein
LEKSINQPALPHAIIALNATEFGIKLDEWDPATATRRLFDTVSGALDPYTGDPSIRAFAELWKERNVDVWNVPDLLTKYYSSFAVVRIPVRGRYGLMDQQVGTLYDVIAARCEDSQRQKKKARLQLNADDFNVYLQAAFDHFAEKLDEPFNFMEVSMRTNPPPENLGDHILQLALAIQNNSPRCSTFTGPMIFQSVGEIVASSILLDSVLNYKGKLTPLRPNVHRVDEMQVKRMTCSKSIDTFSSVHLMNSATYTGHAHSSVREAKDASTPALDMAQKATKM